MTTFESASDAAYSVHSGSAHMTCVNGSGGLATAPNPKMTTTAYFHLSRHVSYGTSSAYDSDDITSGNCAASPNESVSRKRNCVHIVMSQLGLSVALIAFCARNSNMNGKKTMYAYATPPTNSTSMRTLNPAICAREMGTSGVHPRRFRGSFA